MKVFGTLMIAGASAQFTEFTQFQGGFGFGFSPSASYGMYPSNAADAQMQNYAPFFQFRGGGYRGAYGLTCRNNIKSDDLSGWQSCNCDKWHRNEDFCGETWDDKLFGVKLFSSEKECRDHPFFKKFYDEVFDEDCITQWQQPNTRPRFCSAKDRSSDLLGPAVCYCDFNHKKREDDAIDAFENYILGGMLSIRHVDLAAVAMSYSGRSYSATIQPWPLMDIVLSSSANDDCEDEFNAFDPNCAERFGNYGRYRGYGQQRGFSGHQLMGSSGYVDSYQLLGSIGYQTSKLPESGRRLLNHFTIIDLFRYAFVSAALPWGPSWGLLLLALLMPSLF